MSSNTITSDTTAARAALTLDHFADAPIALDRARTYKQPEPHLYSKPHGFWVSVRGEDDWPTWCRSEEFRLGGLTVAHDVSLRPEANVLLLATSAALHAFTDQFGIRTAKSYGGHSWVDVSIDWPRVAREHDGIMIAPYQWGDRMNLNWYYPWDVASGCIWNLDAIASLTLAQAASGAAR